jgi:hypothetical protein
MVSRARTALRAAARAPALRVVRTVCSAIRAVWGRQHNSSLRPTPWKSTAVPAAAVVVVAVVAAAVVARVAAVVAAARAEAEEEAQAARRGTRAAVVVVDAGGHKGAVAVAVVGVT